MKYYSGKKEWITIKCTFFLLGCIFLISCTSTPSEQIREKGNRPIDPWALRSVLDLRPRILTLALDSECYLAYDLNACGLYRAWKGGVNWDGTVYTETKVAQPTSWGKDYFLNPSPQESWLLEQNGRKQEVTTRFQGYRFENGQVYLKYKLTTEKDTIFLEERPEFIRDDQGNPGLERVFMTQGMDGNLSITLHTKPKAIKLENNTTTISRTFFKKIPDQVRPIGPKDSENLGKYWMERSDCFTCHEWSEKTVGPGFQQIAEKYPKDKITVDLLVKKIKEGGSGVWGEAVMNPHPNLEDSNLKAMVHYILSLSHKDSIKKNPSLEKKAIVNEPPPAETKALRPGFGSSLNGVHPSYDLQIINVEGIEFKVGGLAFQPDGRLLVSSWTPQGEVYILEGVETGDSDKIKIKTMAKGLAEPLGLSVVEDEIFVLQKQELTQLIDHDGDGITDEYKSICNSFDVSMDFHEFAFGLVYKDGYFYANLSMPMRLMSNEKPLPDRGKTLKIAKDGSYEEVIHGLRTPNGIGIGVDEELFVTDNQGQWLPANKFIHVKPGDFHGMRWGLPDSLQGLKMVPPAVWLPQNEIANSPSEPSLLCDGPYKNQMIFGDVTHGGIKRVFLETVNGSYQGAVFRFTQGLNVGINRIRRGPDGALYAGGVGMGGGWGWNETRQGLQRLKYNEKVTFEMLAIRSKPYGFEIEFTEPLGIGQGDSPADYSLEQWWYKPTKSYGGPKMDLEVLKASETKVSANRKKVHLTIPGLKKEHVVKFNLNPELRSMNRQNLWSSEAWYTLNNIPKN
ncbi:c-type cytochrome [Ulvibacterium marinum]|uniref:c-type cytochrome n=1 Tax=Ulvibacterium marinum TaxID=2419782 RepID=UPI002494A8DB|nr:c-type cytochrome [Ulvibacterium marinum]